MAAQLNLPNPVPNTPPAATSGSAVLLEDLYNTDHEPDYGQAVQIALLVQRITARNPSPFTFAGTGSYIIGDRQVAVIDPGPDDAAHVTALLRALEGRTVTHICVTHTHSDHSPASRALAAATGAPVLGFGPHPASDARRSGIGTSEPAGFEEEEAGDWEFAPDIKLTHGDVLAGDGWRLECLHTPGHISNHLCFGLMPEGNSEGGLFTGDHVMGWSSTIIPPPDGNLGDYLRSLELLIERLDRDLVYWPTHGPPIETPGHYVRALLAHRHRRTDQILACLRDGPATISGLVARIYVKTPPALHLAAERSVLAHLIYLANQGVVSAESTDDERARQYSLT